MDKEMQEMYCKKDNLLSSTMKDKTSLRSHLNHGQVAETS
jgi:hypothetical protein